MHGLNNARRAVSREGADALIVVNRERSGQPGTEYLSGFSGSSSLLLITSREMFIVTDGRYHAQVEREAPHAMLVRITQGAGTAFDMLVPHLRRLRVRSVLVDGTRTTHAEMQKLAAMERGIKIVSKDDLLANLRTVKSDEEVALIRKAGAIARRAFTALKPFIKPGASERWLAAKLEFLMKEHGADGAAFDTIVASGKNGALPHARPGSKKLKSDELVTIDFGAKYRGYMSDVTRTIAVGKISTKLAEVYEAVKNAQALGCKGARAGMTGAELDAICRGYLAKRGYEKYFIHGTGHGLGMEVHEPPYVNSMNNKKLPAGAVITCEPGIYIRGLGGARIEDDLVLKKNGALNLTGKIG